MINHKEFELSFKGEILTSNYATPNLTATFCYNNKKTIVKGFYDGEGVYKIRFLPREAGEYHWSVEGCITASGKELCTQSEEYNGLVQAKGLHFAYENGIPYYPFGTTVYALAHQPDELVEKTLNTLKNAPFNKVRMCVFPKHFEYNHNEPPLYAFEKDEQGNWDTSRPCISFWQRLEKIIDKIGAMKIEVDLILFHPYDNWGFSQLTQSQNFEYLENLIRRLAAKPYIWWSLANEYDVCANKSLEDFCAIEEYVAQNDPFGHLLSNHNCYQPWDSTRSNITHVSMQTKSLNRINEWLIKYKKPIVVDEACYEGNISAAWGCISAFEMVSRFWKAVVTGGYCTHGETYLDEENEILWWAKGGELHGESPQRIAFLKSIVEELPAPIENVPDHLRYAANPENRQEVLQRISHFPQDLQDMFKALFATDYKELEYILDSDMAYQGKVADKVFLTFYYRRCCIEDTINLPSEGSYKVEAIDIWEMTRTVIAENANGRTKVKLPAKEGIAVMATKQ